MFLVTPLAKPRVPKVEKSCRNEKANVNIPRSVFVQNLAINTLKKRSRNDEIREPIKTKLEPFTTLLRELVIKDLSVFFLSII